MPLNIAVIGRGSIGMISTLQLITKLHEFSVLENSNITVFYDPRIPEVSVGEATTWIVADLLNRTLGEDIDSILDEVNATLRKGGEFNWENATGNNFVIDYDSYGIHFDSSIFSKFVLEKLRERFPNLTVVEENVHTINNRVINYKYSFDFILNSSGSPSKEELLYGKNYITPNFVSVNSVLLYQHKGDFSSQEFSYSTFHNNGWMFGIPLRHRKAFGYLYNRDITTKEEGLEEFHSLLNKEVGDIQDLENKVINIKWNFYYRKQILSEGEVFLGNKVYFFEPAQALPIHFYFNQLENILPKLITLYINEGTINTEDPLYTLLEYEVNKVYDTEIFEALNILAFNYSGDVENPSRFWSITGEKAREFLRHSPSFQAWIKEHEECNNCFPGFWSHDPGLMYSYINNLDINIKELKNNE